MNHATLLLATLEPCWLWWLILSALAFILGAILGCMLCGKRKRLAELETENAGLKARVVNWEKDYAGLKYELEEGEKDRKGLRVKLQSCEADKMILEGKLSTLQDAGESLSLSTAGPAMGAASGIAFANIFPNDNLQVVEGVGPKLEEVLKAAGIGSWAVLAKSSEEELRKVLTDSNPNYRIHNPSSWPKQAQLAADGDWEGLIAYQQELDGAVGLETDGKTPSKVEKMSMRILGFSTDPEDLKIIEGIGPKIEKLLKADGIKTWQGLADAEVSRIQAVLDRAGDSFRLANPETWPEQAALAAAGRWGELSDLQDRLQGGVDRG